MKRSLRTQTQCVTDVTSVCFETCADCKDFWLGKTLFDSEEVKNNPFILPLCPLASFLEEQSYSLSDTLLSLTLWLKNVGEVLVDAQECLRSDSVQSELSCNYCVADIKFLCMTTEYSYLESVQLIRKKSASFWVVMFWNLKNNNNNKKPLSKDCIIKLCNCDFYGICTVLYMLFIWKVPYILKLSDSRYNTC